MGDIDGVSEIVLTGGPCAGKSTAMSVLVDRIASWGMRALVVPEVPTLLIAGGLADIGAIAASDGAQFLEIERAFLRLTRALRTEYRGLARTFVERGERVVILYDRGESDVAAYLDRDVFTALCAEERLTAADVRDSYDGVIHLVTAAIGAEMHYTTANNAARRESPAEAAALDARTRDAWVGHPRLHIIDNSTDFPGKIERVVRVVSELVGVRGSFDRKRRFLVAAMPDVSFLERVGARGVEIEQVYLPDPGDGLTERIRRRGPAGAACHSATTKAWHPDGSRIVRERTLRPGEFRRLLASADPSRRPVEKVRHHFVHAGACFELDEFRSHQGLVLLEVAHDGADTDLVMPPGLDVVREVTADPAYQNASLARR